jgi:hypothetical protein
MTGYTWSVSTGGSINGSSTVNTVSVTWTVSGSQSVFVNYTDSHGCTAITPTVDPVTVTNLSTASISYAGTPFCNNLGTPEPITLTGTGVYTGGTFSSTAGLTLNAVTGDITPNTSTAGTYTVTYTIPASGGCGIVTTTTSITVTAVPTALISYAGTPFCNNLGTPQPVTLTGTGVYTGGTFSSTAGLTLNAINGNINPDTSIPGAYTVTYTIPASGGCGIVTTTTSVTVTAIPTALISYAGTPFCNNLGIPQPVTLTGTGVYTGGTFSSTGGLTLNAVNGDITPNTSTAGTYTVNYTIPAGGGCGIVTTSTSVTVTAVPTALISYAGTPFCNNLGTPQPVTLTGTGVYTGGTFSSTAGLTLNAVNGDINPGTSTPGTYTVTYTIPAGGGCGIVTTTTSVTVTAVPTASISYAGTPFCNNLGTPQPVTLTGTGVYTGGTFSSTAGLTLNAVNGNINPGTSSPGTYTVTYTIPAGGGCGIVTTTTSVTVTAVPTASISYTGTPFCNNLGIPQPITLTGTGVYTGGTFSSTAGLTLNAVTGDITPNTSIAGTYTVTYTIPAGGGCSIVTTTTSVTVTAVPTASISYTGTPFCNNLGTPQPITLAGTGVYTGGTFSSTAGLTLNAVTGDITPNTSIAGTYTVTYTIPAGGGCGIVTTTTSVTVTAVPTASISYAGTPFCNNLGIPQPVTLTGTGVYTGGTFSSTGGLTLNTVTGDITPNTSTAGTYTVNYTIPAGGGCGIVTTTTSVTVTAVPTALISYAGTPFCNNLGTPQPVTLTGTGVYTGGTFSSTAGLTLNAVNGDINPGTSTPGTYTVTYTIPAGGGCGIVTTTTSATVTAVPTASISYAGAPFCNNLGTPQPVTLTGTGVYTGGTFSSTAGLTLNAVTGDITPNTSTAGPYTVNYTIPAGGGCGIVTTTTSVTVTAVPTALISYTGTPFCTSLIVPQPVTLSGTGAFSGGTFSSTAGLTLNAVTGDITPNTSTAGTYTVTYTIPAGGGCGIVTTTTSITVTAVPTALISYAGTPFCNNLGTPQPVTLTGTGVYTGGTFSSTAGLTLNAINGNINPDTSIPGAYTVTYTIPASGGCGIVTTTTSVTVTAIPTALISYAGTPFCNNLGIPQPVALTGTGVYTGGTFSSTGGLTLNTVTGDITPNTSTAGTYTVNYTIPAGGGCGIVTTTTSVTVTAVPTALISYAGTPFCNNLGTPQPVTLTGTGVYTGGTFSSTAGLTLNAVNGDINPGTSTPGTYTVTYTIPAGGGCGIVTTTTSVTVTAVPTASISYAGTPFCNNLGTPQPVTLTGTGVYTGGTFSSTAGLTLNAVNGNINPGTSSPGTYTVTYTIPAGGGCGIVTTTTSVTVTAVPTASISYTGTPFCNNLGIPQPITLTGTGVYTGGTFSSTAGLTLNAVTGDITPNTSIAGTYTVTYTIPAGGGCSIVTTTTSVTVTAVPTASISYTGTPFCNNLGTPQPITLTGTGVYTGGTFSSTAGLTLNAVTGDITPNTSIAGTYTVTYTIPAGGGCSIVTTTTSVTVTAVPTASISYAGAPFCNNLGTPQPVTLTGTGVYTGGTFSSTAGLTLNAVTGDITPNTSTAGPYTVNYTIPAGGGCGIVTTTTSVTVTAVPTASISYTGTPFCNNLGTPQPITLTGTGVYTGGTFSSTGGLTLNTVTGDITPNTSIAGTYTVTYTIPAGGGCGIVTTTTSVTVTAVPTASISYTGTPFCNNLGTPQPITLTGTGVYTGGTFSSTAGLTLNAVTGDITPNTSIAGTYTVTYTIPAGGGCGIVTTTTSVTVTAVPTALISYAGTPFCNNLGTPQPVTLTGTGVYTGGTFSSTAGLTLNAVTGDITPNTSTAGPYTVNYTIPAGGGCGLVTTTTSVTVTAVPTALISYTGTPFCTSLIVPQPVTLSGTGAFSGGTFSSTAGLTLDALTGDITPSTSTAGTYTVTYTILANGGCGIVTTSTSITVTAVPTALISYAGTPFCNNLVTPQPITLTGTGGYTGGTFSSTAGLTLNAVTGDITPNTSIAGTYTVTYTIPASGGCGIVTTTTSVTVTAVPTALISYAGTPFCNNLGTPQPITLTGIGVYTGGTFSSTGGLTLNTVTGDITPNTSIAGTYTVTYTIPAGGGCGIVTTTTSVTVTAVPTASISYTGTPFCNNLGTPQPITLTGTGVYTGGTFSSTAGLTLNAVTGDITPNTSTAGTYTVTYTIPAGGGCGIVTTTTSVTVTAVPTASISYTGTPFCNNLGTPQPITLTGTGVYTGGTFSSTAGLTLNAVTGDITPNTSIAGTYTVTYTIPASGGCGIVTTTTSVTVTAVPTALISYAGTPFCNNLGTPQPITLTGTGVYTGGTFSSTAGLTLNAVTGDITPNTSTAGTYTVTYTIPASGGCGIVTTATSVTVTAVPTASISYTGTPFCNNLGTPQPVTLTGTGVYTGGTFSSTAGLTLNAVNGNINPGTSSPGTYTVTYTIPAGGGCGIVTTTTSVTVTAVPTASISYAGTPFCNNLGTPQPVTLTGTGVYTGGTFSSTAGLTLNAVTGDITPNTSTAGIYTVTYTIPASAGCSSVGATTQVTITTLTIATFSYTGSPYCINGTNPLPTFNGGGVAGTFSVLPAGLVFISTATGEVDLAASIPGIYTVTNTIAASAGCQQVTANSPIEITLSPSATIAYAGTPFCNSLVGAQSVTRTGSAGGVYAAIPAGLTLDAVTGDITPSTSTPGTYTVTYTIAAANGCSAVTANTSVTVTDVPTASISYPGTPFCKNIGTSQPVTLTGTGIYTGGTFSSTAGLTLNAVNGDITPNTSTAGTYTVTYTILANGGCGIVTTSTSITVTAVPTALISYAGTPFCNNLGTPQPVTLTGTGGYTGGTFSSTAGLTLDASTGDITPNTSNAGTYAVTYTIPASAGCSSVGVTTQVTITTMPTPVISGSQAVCANSTGNIYSTANVPGDTYSWSISGGTITSSATTNSITVTWGPAGPGWVQVTETVGSTLCVVTTSQYNVIINASRSISVSIAASANPVCSATPVTFTATPGGATNYTYQWQQSGVPIAGATNSTYTYTPNNGDAITCVLASSDPCVTNSPVTSSAITMNVSNSLSISVSIAVSANPVCSATPVTFTATPGGATNYTYQWQLSGVPIAGATNSTYTYTPNNGDAITCVLASSDPCVTNSPVTSSAITMTVSNSLSISVSIAVSANPVCSATPVTFTATPGGATNYTYQWQQSGVPIAGATNSTYTYTPNNGDAITCVLASSDPCVTNSPVTSSAITMNVSNSLSISVSIAVSANPVCSATPVTFTATPGGATNYTYQWQLSGVPIAGATNSTYTYTPNNGDAITCVLASSDPCVTNSPVTSSAITMTVSNSLSIIVSIAVSANPVCSATPVTFTATPGGATNYTYQWQLSGVPIAGATNSTYTYTPNNGDAITCVLASSDPCVTNSPVTSAAITMTVSNSLSISVSIAVSANPVCSATPVTFTATPTGATNYTYQWQLSGVPIAGATNSTYTYTPNNGDAITCVLASSDPCVTNSPVTSAAITMTVSNSLPISVSIAVSANPVCSATPVTFTATPTGATNYTYQWQLSGVPIAGATNSTYTYTPNNGDAITCVLASSDPCVTNSPVTSSAITMTVSNSLSIIVSIAVSANPVCSATPVTFTTTPTGATNYSYQWQLSGVPIAGATNSTYTYTPNNGDAITCVLASSDPCVTNSPVTSAAITMTVSNSLPISVSIAVSANPVCSATPVTFTATPTGATNYTYQWQLSGVPIAGATNSTYTYTPNNGDAITCVLASSDPCVTNSPVTSSAITMTVSALLPVSVSITASANPVCAGTPVTFTASPTNGGLTPSYQWQVNGLNQGTNSNSFTYTPGNNDQVTVILTSNTTCATGSPATSNTITMTVINSLSISVSIVVSANPVCSATPVTFTATPTNGGTTPAYQWQVNAINVPGATNPTYTYTPANGDVVTCILTSNATCATGNPATSNQITITVDSSLPVSVSIVASANPVCSATPVTFTATPTNGGTTPLTSGRLMQLMSRELPTQPIHTLLQTVMW